MIFHAIGDIAEVSRHGGLQSLRAKGKSDGVDGVVRNGETGNLNIANYNSSSCLKPFDGGKFLAPGDHRRGFVGKEHGLHQRLADHGEAGNVIAVLMSNKDSVDLGGILADSGKSRKRFAAAQTGVDQNAGTVSGDE